MNKTPTLPRFKCLLIALVMVACFTTVGSQRVTAQATSFTISGTVKRQQSDRESKTLSSLNAEGVC